MATALIRIGRQDERIWLYATYGPGSFSEKFERDMTLNMSD